MTEIPEFFNFASDVMGRWARHRPQAPALWCVDSEGRSEQRFTFRELARAAGQAANALRNHGIRPGDHVVLMMPRVPQWWIAMLGLIHLGAVPVPCAMQLTVTDLTYRIQMASARAVIVDGEAAAKLDTFDGLRFAVGGNRGGWIDFDEAVRLAQPEFSGPPTRSDQPGILYFTSATTGQPKMVLHTQASYGLGHRLTGRLWLDLQPSDVHWNVSDLGWAKAAWSSFYGPWLMGSCVFAVDARHKFDPNLALDILTHYPITTWCAPPTALRLIMRHELSARRFPHLRHCVSAGEPLNPEILSRWQAATGLTLYEAYGQTETVVLVGNYRSLGHPVRPGSMGWPTPGFQVALLDEALRELPDQEEGELAVRVKPQRPLGLFQEYWQNPDEMASRFRGDWYLTGDRAVRDRDGSHWFVGRNDDVIKSAGYRIGPFEVESVLLEHPAVLEAAVVGKPDELRGQIVKAFVVLREGVSAAPALLHELQHHCRLAAAPYKYPREIEFVSELPKTTSGKILRGVLRQRHTL